MTTTPLGAAESYLPALAVLGAPREFIVRGLLATPPTASPTEIEIALEVDRLGRRRPRV